MKKHLLTSFLFGTLTIVLCGIISGNKDYYTYNFPYFNYVRDKGLEANG